MSKNIKHPKFHGIFMNLRMDIIILRICSNFLKLGVIKFPPYGLFKHGKKFPEIIDLCIDSTREHFSLPALEYPDPKIGIIENSNRGDA